MSFWDKALGGASLPPAQPAPSNSRPFWDLTAPRVAQQIQTVVQTAPVPNAALPSKAISAKLHDFCPSCGSDNYFRPSGNPNAMQQCYECGYNPRFEQMAMGAGVHADGGPATPSRQVASAHGGYSGAIVGKINSL